MPENIMFFTIKEENKFVKNIFEYAMSFFEGHIWIT